MSRKYIPELSDALWDKLAELSYEDFNKLNFYIITYVFGLNDPESLPDDKDVAYIRSRSDLMELYEQAKEEVDRQIK